MVGIGVPSLSPRVSTLIVLAGVIMGAACRRESAHGDAPAPRDSGMAIGIPACDDYVLKYRLCIEGHVPTAAKARTRSD